MVWKMPGKKNADGPKNGKFVSVTEKK